MIMPYLQHDQHPVIEARGAQGGTVAEASAGAMMAVHADECPSTFVDMRSKDRHGPTFLAHAIAGESSRQVVLVLLGSGAVLQPAVATVRRDKWS